MIQKIRNSRASKVIACYLALMLVLEIIAPMQAFALTTGPTQPEFNSFTPIGTSDMVDLASGDFTYNIPIMDVGGYPLNLAYNSGVTMDQEASWVGLGWDLNVGQIGRQLRGLPDDFDGDTMIYENSMKPNVTVGANFSGFLAGFGFGESPGQGLLPTGDFTVNGGFGVKYNNYDGFGFSLTNGISYQVSENLSVGANMTASQSEGATIAPNVSFSTKLFGIEQYSQANLGLSVGVPINSRKGVEGLTMTGGVSVTATHLKNKEGVFQDLEKDLKKDRFNAGASIGGSISFVNASYTPTKRVGMSSDNFTFNMNVEGELWGVEAGAKFTGYRTSQGVKESEKLKEEKAYGYQNTYKATDNDVLDFNREKDRSFTVKSTSLPITNYTYDIYSIQGQGAGGQFRPYSGQIGYVYDKHTNDDSGGGSLGGEIGIGGGTHFGVDMTVIDASSSTKNWRDNNLAMPKLEEKKTGNRPDYEKVYFKTIGGMHVDPEYVNLLENKLAKYDAVRFDIGGSAYSRTVEPKYNKTLNSGSVSIDAPLKREKRVNRGQTIQKLTVNEAEVYGFATAFSPEAKKHPQHTAEIRVINDGGERYVYGRAAYNFVKKETTFDVSGQVGDCGSGLVNYSPGVHNSKGNNARGDQYFNRVTTPAYAHTYLLTAVLSSDYSDITGNGPTDDDLGSYTKFVYDDTKANDINTYKWRVPYKKNMANYDEGLRSSDRDDKGSYIYGEKELLYIKKIETKTHVAIFEISVRKDGYGVDNEDGGGSTATTSRMYKLDKISLYSKPEYESLAENAIPIKVAHFEYNYSLCKGVHNNFEGGGKLTLKKVYFTYRDSNMGKFTPYVFDYGPDNQVYNPDYNMKNYDTWGNYKPSLSNAGCGYNDGITNAEFPYVEQDKAKADQYSTAWHLRAITLPSGGRMEIQYESDDYQYVQDKEVMQMFQVVGMGNIGQRPSSQQQLTSNALYNSSGQKNAMFIKIDPTLFTNQIPTPTEFGQKYLKQLVGGNEQMYFRFLVNMAPLDVTKRYDYVTGYTQVGALANVDVFQVAGSSEWYASIPIQLVSAGGGVSGSVNPVTKAGWNFGRQHLNRFVFTDAEDEETDDLEEIVKEVIGAIPAQLEILTGPNTKLNNRNIASRFITGKSWIRLMCPKGIKYGGGSRVKEIKIHDEWQVMTNHSEDEYKQYYGQQYTYEKGVATYEPLGNKENPLVQPFYDRSQSQILLGPNEQNFVELPFGETFYPSPRITYSKVTVKNLPRQMTVQSSTVEVKRHATGKVVTEFYTSKDFPTLVDYTDMDAKPDKSDVLSGLLSLNVKNHLALSQGFTIHTNDMNAKMKSQFVYGEGQTMPLSGMTYTYETDQTQGSPGYNPIQGKLNNVVTTIDSKGNVAQKMVGVDFDMINDFRVNRSTSTTAGLNVNVAALPITIVVVVVPTPMPSYSYHEDVMKSAVTTKVIHTSAILRGQTVYSDGASTSTKNLAWDAETGQVLLTETANEYNDKYYSFNYPAYWAYDGMGQSAKNIGLTWKMKKVYASAGKYQFVTSEYKAKDFLANGDEIWVRPDSASSTAMPFKAYVTDVDNDKFTLISSTGMLINDSTLDEAGFTVIRSGYRNMQSASMASVTSMVNPLTLVSNNKLPENLYLSSTPAIYSIVNAAAIEYNDTWPAQCECKLPKMIFENGALVFNYTDQDKAYNPYVYNVKGNWRPKVSYAYLTGRSSGANANGPNPRKSGFFNRFDPFYTRTGESNTKWIINTANRDKWTYASEVSQYSPYGFEIENKDALNRYSSALYGYNFRFPVAVAANTKYKELAYDGFEDYSFSECKDGSSHFSFIDGLRDNQIVVTSQQAHSGRKSLRVAPGDSVVIKKQIVRCNP